MPRQHSNLRSIAMSMLLSACLWDFVVAQDPAAAPPAEPAPPAADPVNPPEPDVPQASSAQPPTATESIPSDTESGTHPYKLDSTNEIKKAASSLAYDLMLFYPGNKTGEVPGILPGPPTENKGDYYWWEGGAMMGTYIDYWKLTGDSSYNHVIMQGMLHQTGDNGDFMPTNYTASMGNDDQGFWGMSAMLAAENKFPDPPKDRFQWLELAQGVWNTMASPERHDNQCGGGLRWQVPFTNVGYDYKNTIANGIFFNLGARLARYTDNATYAKHSTDTWDWLWKVNYINHTSWEVYDGGHVGHNCKDIAKTQYSYNAAILIQGAAYMYSFTKADEWKSRLDNLLNTTLKTFFPEDIMYEQHCEGVPGHCSTDMLTFKGYVHRWLAVVTQIATHTADQILPVLKKSAEAAVKQCTGGKSGRACGFYWSKGVYIDPSVDHTSGAGEAMNVLAAVSSLLIDDADEPVTAKKGGTSKGNPNAGGDPLGKSARELRLITTGDRVGAGIMTIIAVAIAIGLFAFLLSDADAGKGRQRAMIQPTGEPKSRFDLT